MVTRLRLWGSDRISLLPDISDDTAGQEYMVGSSPTCTVHLEDPAGLVSRRHAQLIREAARWLLRDLGSKNGMQLDGTRRTEITLEPGAEIGIGGLTLIAESSRSVALREFMSRLLGWRSDRVAIVDHALRSIRIAGARRAALVLCGDGDLVPTARSIHRQVMGPHRPFIVCDPRRRPGKATVRVAQNYETGMQAFEAANGGSLCVRGHRLPKDFADLIAALRAPSSRVQLVVCAPDPAECAQFLSVPIDVPPLASRADELDRIIMEYGADATDELGTPRSSFLAADLEWVRTYSAKSLPDIEKGTLRLVAIRNSPFLSSAAERLGMAPVSLSRWIGRRTLPTKVGP
jgi:pSer/pThr/pTyr-binding forkhead associated (FHA) protein